MILNDADIYQRIMDASIGVDPFLPEHIQPASLDVRLDAGFHDPVTGVDLNVGQMRLEPGAFLLASTLEVLRIPTDLVARLDGRSSWGRLGLMVHSTAGFIDPGFEGQVTLELFNVGGAPIRITEGCRIGQVSFHQMTGPASSPYPREGSKYQGQRGPTPSRIEKH